MPRSRTVTAPVLLAGLLVALCACGGPTDLTGAALPGDGSPSRVGGTAQETTPPPPPPGPATTPSRSAQQWLQAARQAFAVARSVRVTGTVVRGADAYVVDVRLAGASGGTATIKTSGRTVEVIRIGTTAYVGGDLAFWRSVTGDPARAARLVGSYVSTTAPDGTFGSFVDFTLPPTFEAVLPDPAGSATLGDTTAIAGWPALAVRDAAGSTLDVATTGPAYPLRLDGLAQRQVVFLDFTGYGDPVSLQAPSPTSLAPSGPGS